MKVINLFAGPGAGKSTTSAGLFHKMKLLGHKVEYVTEYAKEMVYQEEFFRMKDPLMIFARQHHKLWALRGKVDFAIMDGPLLLSAHYFNSNNQDGIYSDQFKSLVMSIFEKYDNHNIFLERNTEYHKFRQYGRIHNLEESINIDIALMDLLQTNKIPFNNFQMNGDIVNNIYFSLK